MREERKVEEDKVRKITRGGREMGGQSEEGMNGDQRD